MGVKSSPSLPRGGMLEGSGLRSRIRSRMEGADESKGERESRRGCHGCAWGCWRELVVSSSEQE